jgi:hypothetical protein
VGSCCCYLLYNVNVMAGQGRVVGSLAGWLAGWLAVWASTGLDKKVRRRKLTGRPHANAMPKQSKICASGLACRQGHGAPFHLPFLPPSCSLGSLRHLATPTPNPLQPIPDFPPLMTNNLIITTLSRRRTARGSSIFLFFNFVHVFKGRRIIG